MLAYCWNLVTQTCTNFKTPGSRSTMNSVIIILKNVKLTFASPYYPWPKGTLLSSNTGFPFPDLCFPVSLSHPLSDWHFSYLLKVQVISYANKMSASSWVNLLFCPLSIHHVLSHSFNYSWWRDRSQSYVLIQNTVLDDPKSSHSTYQKLCSKSCSDTHTAIQLTMM